MDSNIVLSQFTASAVIVWLVELLKTAGWFPWLRTDTDKLNRLLAWVLAAAAAIGIHFEFDPTAGVLTITGLTLANVAHGLWIWLQSGAVTETVYRLAYKRPGVSASPARP